MKNLLLLIVGLTLIGCGRGFEAVKERAGTGATGPAKTDGSAVTEPGASDGSGDGAEAPGRGGDVDADLLRNKLKGVSAFKLENEILIKTILNLGESSVEVLASTKDSLPQDEEQALLENRSAWKITRDDKEVLVEDQLAAAIGAQTVSIICRDSCKSVVATIQLAEGSVDISLALSDDGATYAVTGSSLEGLVSVDEAIQAVRADLINEDAVEFGREFIEQVSDQLDDTIEAGQQELRDQLNQEIQDRLDAQMAGQGEDEN